MATLDDVTAKFASLQEQVVKLREQLTATEAENTLLRNALEQKDKEQADTLVDLSTKLDATLADVTAVTAVDRPPLPEAVEAELSRPSLGRAVP